MLLAPRTNDPQLIVTALGELSPLSRSTYLGCLNRLAKWAGHVDAASCPWQELEPLHVAALRVCLKERYSPSSINVHLSALACIVRACWRQNLITSEQKDRLLDFRREPGSRELAGRALKNNELSALFGCCGGARNAAILSLLYACGLRRSEVAGLDLSDLDGDEIRVIGKRNKERRVFLNSKAKAHLDAWLRVRGTGAGPLFKNPRGSRLSDKAVYRVCKSLAKRARVSAFTPHDLRRTMVSNLLDGGADLVTVQSIAGHASPAMTARYDRRRDDVKRRASALLYVP